MAIFPYVDDAKMRFHRNFQQQTLVSICSMLSSRFSKVSHRISCFHESSEFHTPASHHVASIEIVTYTNTVRL